MTTISKDFIRLVVLPQGIEVAREAEIITAARTLRKFKWRVKAKNRHNKLMTVDNYEKRPSRASVYITRIRYHIVWIILRCGIPPSVNSGRTHRKSRAS